MALSEFIATIAGQDLSRQNRYEVEIHGPGGLADRTISMLCESAQFPGQNIRTTADSLRAGPQREMGQGVTYGPITLRFICRPHMPEKKYFEDWQDLMVDKNTWQMNYYKNYIGEISMKALDVSDRDRYNIVIHEAYPKIITAQDFSYSSNNAYQTVSVEFTYWFWESDNVPPRGKGPRRGCKRKPPTTTQKTPADAGQDDMDDDWGGVVDSGGTGSTSTGSNNRHPAFTHHNSNNARGE